MQTVDEAAKLATNSETEEEHLPDWLKRLSTESWQAELLISGIAIVGSWQLSSTIEPMAKYLLFNVRLDYLGYARWVLYYFSLGVAILPFLFAFHFAVRAWWVGLVGLISVFPRGYGKERWQSMPESLIDDVKENYPGLRANIDWFDKLASIMFACTGLVLLTFTGISAALACLVVLAYVIESASDGRIGFQQIFYILLCILTLYWLVVWVLSSKFFQSKPRTKHLHKRLSRGFRYITYGPFERFITPIQTLLITNIPPRRLIVPAIISYVVLVLVVVSIMRRPFVAILIEPDDVYEDALLTQVHFPSKYADQWDTGHDPFLPWVEREQVSPGEKIYVEFPLLGEDKHRISMQSQGDEDDNDNEEEGFYQRWKQDSLSRVQRIANHARYFRFWIDGQAIEPLSINFSRTPTLRSSVRAVIALPRSLSAQPVLQIDSRKEDDQFEPRARIQLLNTLPATPSAPQEETSEL